MENGWSALLWAIHKEETDTVNLLIEKGADVNVKEETYGRNIL